MTLDTYLSDIPVYTDKHFFAQAVLQLIGQSRPNKMINGETRFTKTSVTVYDIESLQIIVEFPL